MQTQTKRDFVNKVTIKLKEFEKERQKRLKKLILINLFITVAIIIIYKISILCYTQNLDGLSVFGYTAILVGIIYFFMNIFDYNKDFKNFIKTKCTNDILNTFDLDTIYNTPTHDNILRASNLFPQYTYSQFDDIIKGIYNGVSYKIEEIKLIAKSRKSESTLFKGVVISFQSNKKFKTETLVATKGDNNIRNNVPNLRFHLIYMTLLFLILPMTIFFPFFWITFSKFAENTNLSILQQLTSILKEFLPIFGCIFAGIIIPLLVFVTLTVKLYLKKKKMQDVKLEDVSFEKRFNVYTKDQIEARYLLTPTFMERLKSLQTAFGTKKIKCSFFDDKIMFAIPVKKDLFELGSLFRTLSSNKPVEAFYEEINSIHQMIEHLKLNEKTGL